jgi:hypothetical protein
MESNLKRREEESGNTRPKFQIALKQLMIGDLGHLRHRKLTAGLNKIDMAIAVMQLTNCTASPLFADVWSEMNRSARDSNCE